MRFWKSWVVGILSVLCGGILVRGSDTLPRYVDVNVSLGASGNAEIERVEKVPSSPLGQLYCEHAKAMDDDARVRSNFLKEVERAYAPIFSRSLRFTLEEQQTSGTLHRTLRTKVAGLAKADAKDKTLWSLGIRQFKSPKQLAPYYESVLDPKLMESTFLGSVTADSRLVSTDTTVFRLPQGSELANEKELSGRTWKVDFGGGSVMTATLSVDPKGPTVVLKEQIVVTKNPPKALLAKDNTALFDQLREYAAFVIQFRSSSAENVEEEPVAEEGQGSADYGLDFSGSWSFGLNESFSHSFVYQQVVTVKPTISVSFNFGVQVKWEWRWYWSGWRLRCTLDYFETKVTIAPGVGASLDITAGAAITKNWEKDVVTKTKPFSFTVACVPVVIVLEVNFKLKASCGIQGAITVGTGGKVTLNTVLTCKYQNGWQQVAPSFTVTPQFTGSAHASAGITSTAKGEAPLTLSAYLYYVAGPFARVTPFIETTSNYQAQTGGQTGVHFNLHGGFVVSGGAKVAGWLQSLLGNLGEFNRDFYTKDVTIYDGWAN